MAYYVITNSEDGLCVEEMDEQELLDRIIPDEDWEYYYGDAPKFVQSLDWEDTEGRENEMLIIKGEIVVPTPTKVVQTYTL